jgi:hypothetical protein
LNPFEDRRAGQRGKGIHVFCPKMIRQSKEVPEMFY